MGAYIFEPVSANAFAISQSTAMFRAQLASSRVLSRRGGSRGVLRLRSLLRWAVRSLLMLMTDSGIVFLLHMQSLSPQEPYAGRTSNILACQKRQLGCVDFLAILLALQPHLWFCSWSPRIR